MDRAAVHSYDALKTREFVRSVALTLRESETGMGDLIDLAEIRRARAARGEARPKSSGARDSGGDARAEFFFDLACPFSYLAAERVERTFEDLTWRPASGVALHRRPDTLEAERVRRAAEVRAAQLRMPLQWPDGFPSEVPGAMRAASFAIEYGRGPAFILAAGRLAFCGGFDLDDPEVLAEAAAAAGVPLDACLQAAGDVGRDGAIEREARRLLAAGADQLPALRVGRGLLWGEQRLATALSMGRFGVAALSR